MASHCFALFLYLQAIIIIPSTCCMFTVHVEKKDKKILNARLLWSEMCFVLILWEQHLHLSKTFVGVETNDAIVFCYCCLWCISHQRSKLKYGNLNRLLVQLMLVHTPHATRHTHSHPSVCKWKWSCFCLFSQQHRLPDPFAICHSPSRQIMSAVNGCSSFHVDIYCDRIHKGDGHDSNAELKHRNRENAPDRMKLHQILMKQIKIWCLAPDTTLGHTRRHRKKAKNFA